MRRTIPMRRFPMRRTIPMRGTKTASVTAAAAALLLAMAATPAPAAAQEIAITNATAYPVTGPPVEGATVLLRDGTIAAVGTDVDVPAGARRIDAAGAAVTPGLFDLGTSMGLVEVGAVGDTRDYAMRDDPVMAAFDVVDGLNPNSTLIPVNRLGGVTTVLSSPSGGLIAGQAAVIDLTGGSLGRMLAEPRAAMVASYGSGAADDVGGARGAVSLRLREVLEDARFWAANRAAYDRGAARALSHSRLDLAALQPVLAGEMPFLVEVDRASDILAAMRIAGEYGLDLVVAGGAEAWMVADSLAAAEVPVIVKPLTNLPTGFEQLGARFDNAALLEAAGVEVAISTFDTHNARNLTQEAGNAVRFGMPWDAALEAVTLRPAVILGVADRYGTLEPGKVANVVVWSGEDPFELSVAPEAVIIRGEVMPETSRQRRLLERYRELDGRAPAYPDGGGEGGAP